MYIGEQLTDLSDRKLSWVAQLGVEHIAVQTDRDIARADGSWDVDRLRGLKTRLASFGLSLDVLTLGMESVPMSQSRFSGIVMALPSRDEEIALVQQRIRVAGAGGVPCLKYNFNFLGVPRTGRTPGRGGALYSHFNINEWTDHSVAPGGPISEDEAWDRIAYFLRRVIPVAEANGVRLACHPHDPAVPRDVGLRGVHCVLGSIDGLKRLIELEPSPVNGLNFCQGTVAEMCINPATEVLAAIRTFGATGKIFMVHLRNIRGGFLNFDEVYPDNGDVDFLRALRAYRDAGYRGMFCPDHVPQSAADPDGERQHSFCLGYTKGLLQAIEAESGGSAAVAS
ncbi:MAG: mannonate dehydratase [Chloroflexi bacterium]|nr:mannonate dehydratase [Chloroflexota bacterium]